MSRGARWRPEVSWRATKMVVQGTRERMYCHIAPIRMPCSRSLACCPVDLICRIADVDRLDTYAPFSILIRGPVTWRAQAHCVTSLPRVPKENLPNRRGLIAMPIA